MHTLHNASHPKPFQMVSDANHSVVKEQDDEDAAMAAMFQAQSANWEETQEKMSQFVRALCPFYFCSSQGLIHFLFASFPIVNNA